MNKFLRRAIVKAALRDALKYKYNDEEQYDPDRIFFSIGNDKYIIRLWDIFKDKIVDYTLYKDVGNHGEEIVSGLCDLDIFQ